MHFGIADWITLISALVAIEMAIGHGTIQLTNAIPDGWVPRVQAWCNLLAGVGSIAITFLSRAVTAAIAIVVVVVALAPAGAADLKFVKPAAAPAPAAPSSSMSFLPLNVLSTWQGVYVGGFLSGSGTGVNVLDLGTATANGTSLGLELGFENNAGAALFGAHVALAYEMTSPGTAVGAAFSDKLFWRVGGRIGGNVASMLNIPQVNLGALGTGTPFADFDFCGEHGGTGMCAGLGMKFAVANSMWDAYGEYINVQLTNHGGTAAQPISTDNRFVLGANRHF